MNQRKQYRVKVQEGRDLRVTLLGDKGQAPCPGIVIDVSAEGIGASFPASECRAVAVGAEVELSLTSDQIKTPLLVLARVRQRLEETGSRQYGFQFTDCGQFERRLSHILHALFNRRSAYRVEPDPDSPVEVALEPIAFGTSEKSELVNISAGGLSVRLPVDRDSAFSETSLVKLTFSLPDCQRPFALVGDIRSRVLAGIMVNYGIAFSEDHSEHFARQADAISNYVTQCQREILSCALR